MKIKNLNLLKNIRIVLLYIGAVFLLTIIFTLVSYLLGLKVRVGMSEVICFAEPCPLPPPLYAPNILFIPLWLLLAVIIVFFGNKLIRKTRRIP